MAAPTTLDERIATLAPGVDEGLRVELQQLLRTLRDVGYPEGVLDTMMRLGLRLTARLYEAVRCTPSSDNLFSRLEELTRQKHLPDEMTSYLHLIRILSNKPHHDAEQVRLQIADAENVLSGFLRVLGWFYCECPHGPRLPTIYSAEPVPPVTLTQMLETFLKSQLTSEEEKRRLQAELEHLRAQQAAADQRRRELLRERVVGPVPGAVVQHFKDRLPELRTLREWLTDENLRLILVCGRGGMGKTTLITRLLHDVQLDFTLHLEAAAYEVDSIVYVALRQSEFRSPDKIVELICRTLEPHAAQELRMKWQEQTSLADKLEFLFRRTLGARRCLIVLDSFEDVLDEENRIRDEFSDLRQFVEKCLEYDHSARLVATSRRTLVLPPELEGRIGGRRAELPLDEGLPEAEAVALLRELDGDGRLGIRDAPDTTLRDIVHRCEGIPRTLETLVGTLRQRRTWTLTRLLQDEAAFSRLIENPARELYESLSPEERLVMQALAVYDRPVPAAAVRYLLPAMPVDEILDALVRNYTVDYDRDRFSLHPLDQRYAYQQIPDADGDYTKSALHTRAAAFFRELRKPQAEWKTIDDLEPQLQEFHHLVQAGLCDEACKLLNEIDPDYLSLWGYYSLVVELRSQLIDRLTEPALQADNWYYLGSALEDIGEIPRAITYCERALEIARNITGRKREARSLNLIGLCYYDLGQLEQAIEYHKRALEIDREIGYRQGEVVDMANLGEVFCYLARTREAEELLNQGAEVAQLIRYPYGHSACLFGFGLCCKILGDTEKAIESTRLALSLAREADTVEYQSRSLLLLGSIYHHLGESEDARHCYEEALALGFARVNYGSAVKLGILCLEEGKVEEAQDYFARGIALCRELLDKTPRLYDALYALALAQLGSGQPEEALANYRQALEVCSTKGVVQAALQDLALLQRTAQPAAKLAEAEALLKEAMRKD